MSEPTLNVYAAKTNLRLSRRLRFKMWVHRTWLRLRYGAHIIELMDDVEQRVMREFIFGQEFNVED